MALTPAFNFSSSGGT